MIFLEWFHGIENPRWNHTHVRKLWIATDKLFFLKVLKNKPFMGPQGKVLWGIAKCVDGGEKEFTVLRSGKMYKSVCKWLTWGMMWGNIGLTMDRKKGAGLFIRLSWKVLHRLTGCKSLTLSWNRVWERQMVTTKVLCGRGAWGHGLCCAPPHFQEWDFLSYAPVPHQ